MNCKICSAEMREAIRHRVRDSDLAVYMICPICDYMCVENAPWLAEAYKKPIDATDTGYILRNIYLGRKTFIMFTLLFGLRTVKTKNFVDYAGGYGMLARLMRDFGLNFFWDDAYTEDLFAQGFEYKEAKKRAEKIAAVTCFECFEHFVDPLLEIDKIIALSDTILFSTQLKPAGAVPDPSWDYYGFNHGQHVSFYSTKTFAVIAQKKGLNFYTDGFNVHLLSKKKLPRNIIRITNILTKLQIDIFLKKCFTSKTTIDQKDLIEREL